MDDDMFISLFSQLRLQYYARNHVVFNYGEMGHKMYFVLQGSAGILIPRNDTNDSIVNVDNISKEMPFQQYMELCYPNFRLIAEKNDGDSFGEIAII
jgi:CRP-like cAMP-binding protein